MDHDELASDSDAPRGVAAPGAAWLGARPSVAAAAPEPGAAWLASAGYLAATRPRPRWAAPAWTDALGLKVTITASFLLIVAGGNNLLSEVSRMANAADPLTQPALADEGLPLMQASDCFTCHMLEGRLVGPSHVEIADFYADKVNSELLHELTGKIRGGGVGVWGAVPMLPHASIPTADAELMIAWILTRSKEEAAKAMTPDATTEAVPDATPTDTDGAQAPETPGAPTTLPDPNGGDGR